MTNYKSALKWFHEWKCNEMGKEAFEWPHRVEKRVKPMLAGYKREVGEKKRRG